MNILTQVLFYWTLVQPVEQSRLLPGSARTPDEINNAVIRALRIPDPLPVPVKPGAVSVARLTHKVPKQAQEAFLRGASLAEKERHPEAIKELERAVALDPEFADAYNNLGVQHFLLKHLPESEAAIRRALELDPAFVTARINLAYFALAKGDAAAAEREAQRALALGDQDGEAQRILELLSADRKAARSRLAQSLPSQEPPGDRDH